MPQSAASARMVSARLATDSPNLSSDTLLPERIFKRMVCTERKRAERSGRRLVLMLLESKSPLGPQLTAKLLLSLSRCIRDTDVAGWYTENEVLGALFTEIAATESAVVELLSGKTHRALVDVLASQAGDIKVSFYIFPDDFQSHPDSGQLGPGHRAFSAMYPDFAHEIDARRRSLVIKRCIDIGGSLTLLLLLSPVLLIIASVVKFTSKGPVLFRQTRLGQFGEEFTFLKFRSMYPNTDHSIHQEYIKHFINRPADHSVTPPSNGLYKIKNDPRITKVGTFLRRTSLDELPQLFNVLSGQMSLVGPRPPLPYEFSSYKTWHKRRLFVKPGITGYWQVEGRSRVKFDEMVRMDLRYAKSWSLWLDIKILLRTPFAVLSGDGAY